MSETTTTTTIPSTLIAAMKQFSNPQKAWEFFRDMRWPGGVTCPFCQCDKTSFLSTRQSWKCKGCKKQFSVKTGTVLQGSPLPLEQWFMAMWLLSHCKNGISSYEMAESIGVSQQTAWFMGHRLRHAMKVGSIEKMEGEVEVDETYIGGRAAEMHSDRRAEMRAQGFPKICAVGILQRDGEVRTMVVDWATAQNVQGAIQENVAEGTKVVTDSARAYSGVEEKFTHEMVDDNHGQYVNDNGSSTNRIENYWSGLKRTYHGSYIHYSAKHAGHYLAEQEFRFNNRGLKDGARFAAITVCAVGKRLPYAELTATVFDAPKVAPIDLAFGTMS